MSIYRVPGILKSPVCPLRLPAERRLEQADQDLVSSNKQTPSRSRGEVLANACAGLAQRGV